MLKDSIAIISRCYIKEKRNIKADELGIEYLSNNSLKTARRIVDTIEKSALLLENQERFIIVNEVLKGKTGKWYLDYMSEATYYRHRRNAYLSFIKNLDN